MIGRSVRECICTWLFAVPPTKKVEGAGSKEVDGIYRVSPNYQFPPRTACCVSGETLPRSMPAYTREGGGFLLTLIQTETENTENTLWCITRYLKAINCRIGLVLRAGAWS